MNNIELQALRRLLFFSVPEAARLVAASNDRPDGVQERTWRRWEDGTLAVPDNIAQTMTDLCDWRRIAIGAMRKQIDSTGDDADIVLIWYDILDDWVSMPGREPILWRPQCSVVAEAAGMGLGLVLFDNSKYMKWLGDMVDSEIMRGEWAAAVV